MRPDASPVAWLDELDPGDAVTRAGAKVGRLVELRRIGMWVPDGFAVTTDAYRRFCVQTGLDRLIDRMVTQVSADDPASADVASAEIRAAFEATEIPADLSATIADAYEELADRCYDLNVPVAVRSSATGEDGTSASFAGQFDTFLGVSGADRVVDCVRRCWAGLFSARALHYRAVQGRSHVDSPMAVGVIELVHARASGVAFSIHPVTGKRDRLVIEGSWGWGEAVVQGLVTPDHIEVDKADGRVLRHDVAHKAVVSAFDYERGQVVEIEMPKRLRDKPVLDAEQVAAVTEAVVDIERHYGYPVDVEWVIDRHRRPGEPVHVVQTRPETVHAADDPDAGPGSEAAPRWDPVAYAARYAFGGRR